MARPLHFVATFTRRGHRGKFLAIGLLLLVISPRHKTNITHTHFYGRDRKKTKQLAARRYFCLQCHVSQRDAEPLVENNYMTKP